MSRRAVLGGALAVGAAAVLAACAGPTGGSPGATSSGAAAGSAASTAAATTPPSAPTPSPTAAALSPQRLTEVAQRYQGRTPKAWGLEVDGVVLRSTKPAVALTFDACGGPGGAGVDTDLIALLHSQRIPATLFLNSRWIEANRALAEQLAADDLFEIGNHGTRHLPLSVSGRSAYGIKGTTSVQEVVDEVAGNHDVLARLTGKEPRYFRPGTAYYDDVAVKIVRDLGEIPVNFDVNGDAGATFTKDQVIQAVGTAKHGSIIISHMNQPKGMTAEGYAVALPKLVSAGYTFAKLDDLMLA
ncbi:polysaccharide deacetylase family protein [Raineyella fluvialis]|uniref:Polysaccharide deacetylase family protein n=1 Tax=Raineyella fluvialis TaxID=2662261 RepID=A0A5Q2F8A5_9ACTN|nr:polysaccharide deacetylase family protein [Raineyella fluvialis]QGF22681.1 polysaccharide deacetylase family protein [Raineyella fluvialis]